MMNTEPVLVSVSIVVTAPVSETSMGEPLDEVREAFLDMVAERLRACVGRMEQEEWFDRDAGVDFHYLNEENAGRCTYCGRWTSDADVPSFLDFLMIGKRIKGNLTCDECLHFAPALEQE